MVCVHVPKTFDRRVEICVPSCDVDEVKKVFEASESGVKSFIFDLEDTVIPSAENLIVSYQNINQVLTDINKSNFSSLPNQWQEFETFLLILFFTTKWWCYWLYR